MWAQSQVPENITVDIVNDGGGGFLESSLGSAALGAITALIVVILSFVAQYFFQKRQFTNDGLQREREDARFQAQRLADDERFRAQRLADDERWADQIREQARQSVRADLIATVTQLLKHLNSLENAYRGLMFLGPDDPRRELLATVNEEDSRARVLIQELKLLGSTQFCAELELVRRRLKVALWGHSLNRSALEPITDDELTVEDWDERESVVKAGTHLRLAARMEMGVADPEEGNQLRGLSEDARSSLPQFIELF